MKGYYSLDANLSMEFLARADHAVRMTFGFFAYNLPEEMTSFIKKYRSVTTEPVLCRLMKKMLDSLVLVKATENSKLSYGDWSPYDIPGAISTSVLLSPLSTLDEQLCSLRIKAKTASAAGSFDLDFTKALNSAASGDVPSLNKWIRAHVCNSDSDHNTDFDSDDEDKADPTTVSRKKCEYLMTAPFIPTADQEAGLIDCKCRGKENLSQLEKLKELDEDERPRLLDLKLRIFDEAETVAMEVLPSVYFDRFEKTRRRT